MTDSPPKPEWDATSVDVLRDQPKAYDDMRQRCPIAYSDRLGWSVFRHADVVRILDDHEVFGNAVSKHRSVPNGMDPPEHTAYRQAIEPYFTEERMRRFEPTCRAIGLALLEPLVEGTTFDCMGVFATPFALHCQCAFLGWPDALAGPIRRWSRKNQEATRAGHREKLVEVAEEFESYVKELLASIRTTGVEGRQDVTGSLMRARVNGAPLTDAELISIFRNWTVGEVGSLAYSVGIVAHYLAVNLKLQQRVRAELWQLPAVIEEVLRCHGPLVLNRRVAKRDAEVAGQRIRKGERVSLMWIAANRDERVFEVSAEVQIGRNQQHNLLYGAGIHVCPGAPLARLELRVALEALLRHSEWLGLDARAAPEPAVYPANGWVSLPMRLS